jgi:hypothetical protein
MAKITSTNAEIKQANPDAAKVTVDAGGKPNPGTPKDKRLKENKAVISH